MTTKDELSFFLEWSDRLHSYPLPLANTQYIDLPALVRIQIGERRELGLETALKTRLSLGFLLRLVPP
ncbi:hypothetical protein H5410_019853 [Solanum commersonii]|uniref:Uncharacterized protein n=1 Tax=Solanum commersonii TaxID=4109 RepID=A0A9J5ZAS9_SOLCO|nr:hypothetical protein H5410_019853 [Solanum commersonii]